MMEVTTKVTFVVKDKDISGLLCCAFEGGSNYWYQIESYHFARGKSMRHFQEGGVHQDPDNYWHPSQVIPLHEDCAVIISCEDHTNEGNAWSLDRSCLERGLRLMRAQYPHHWADFVGESADGTTGDIFLQLALFGEVVLG